MTRNHMQNLSDKKLDELMRKLLKGHDAAFDPVAWQQMEKKLNLLKGNKAGNSRDKWGWTGLFLLLLIPFTLYLMNSPTKNAVLSDHHAKELKTDNGSFIFSLPAKEKVPQHNQIPHSIQEKNQGQDLEKGSEGKTEGSLEVQPASSSKEKEVVNVTDQRAANYNGGNNNTHAHSAIPEKLSSRSSLIASSLSAFPIIPSWEGKSQEMKTEKAKEENNKKFAKPAIISLGLILAPDLSALGFTGPYKPGYGRHVHHI